MWYRQYNAVKDDDSQLGATFKLFDKNGDGLISAEELKGGLEALGK
jgi:Ca2+-binding EF-hand superfamily protein